jgi:hypothetical protein
MYVKCPSQPISSISRRWEKTVGVILNLQFPYGVIAMKRPILRSLFFPLLIATLFMSPLHVIAAEMESFDKSTGQGVMIWPSGQRYQGGFVDGTFSGRGILTFPSGGRYDGEFIAGEYSGQGVMTYADGSRYEGGWLNDKKSGRGIFTWPSGKRYEGEFIAGHYFEGVMTYKDGSRYEGGWQNSKYSGEGIRTLVILSCNQNIIYYPAEAS